MTGGQGTATWNVRRGMAGTAAVPHSTGATVRTIGPVMRTSLSGPTIPFVFREVSSLNPFADQGVPKSLTWYTSQNQRTP